MESACDPIARSSDSKSEATLCAKALEALLSSYTFRAAQSQRKIIRYVVEESLAGRSAEIKEFSIAVQALNKGESFDPRLDPIVRTEARKLRLRLARYYEKEGRQDPVRIQLPKGSYLPVFFPNTVESVREVPVGSASVSEIVADEQLPSSEARVTIPQPVSRWNWPSARTMVLIALAILALGSGASGRVFRPRA